MISFENVLELEALLDPRLEIRKHSLLSLSQVTTLQVLHLICGGWSYPVPGLVGGSRYLELVKVRKLAWTP